MIVTSPPYANQRAGTYGGIKPDKYVDWFRPIAGELQRVLKPDGTFILNIKEPAVQGERHTCVIELILDLRDHGWLWTEEFVWHKKNCYPGKWPNRFRDAWERVLQFNKQRQFKMNQEAVMVPVGDWYDHRMRNLSRTDRTRDESRVGSGFGKKVENWVGRDKAYPTNVLHGATECNNRNHYAPSRPIPCAVARGSGDRSAQRVPETGGHRADGPTPQSAAVRSSRENQNTFVIRAGFGHRLP